MSDILSEFESLLKGELNATDLGKLKTAVSDFISGTPEEQKAAQAIADSVKAAIAAYLKGDLSKSDLDFVLKHAKDGAVALVDAKALRLRKTVLNAFFKVIVGWLLSKI